MSTRTAPELAFSRGKPTALVFQSSRQGAFAAHRDLDRCHAKIISGAVDENPIPKMNASEAETKPFGLLGAVRAMRAHANAHGK